MRHKRQNSSFFVLLIKNYLAFSITTLLVLFVVVAAGITYTGKALKINVDEPEKYINILKKDQYVALKVKNLVSDGGAIEILDESHKVIYSDGNKEIIRNAYTEAEYKLIRPILELPTELFATEYSVDGKNKLTLLQHTRNPIYTGNDSVRETFEVVDSTRRIVQSNDINRVGIVYSLSEFEIAKGLYKKGIEIRKFSYVNDLGRHYDLIMKTKKVTDTEILKQALRDGILFGIVFILIYIGCIGLFILWLNRKVKIPLNKLNQAMIALTEEKNSEPIFYSGPSEFVSICDSFNILSEKLKLSEQERNYLQQEKQRMVADISHDFKTPITAIQGYAHAIKDQLVNPEDIGKYINLISERANNLTVLIDRFHEYSKLEHPNMAFELQPIDFAEYLRSYLAIKYDSLCEAKLDLEVEIPEKMMVVKIDKFQMDRALDNLIYNAIKYNPKGTMLYVTLKEGEDNLLLTIADDGIGIPAEVRDKIFDPFITGDESRQKNSGSGLGLSITNKILQMHQASIRLIEEPPIPYTTLFEIRLKKYREIL